MTEGLGTSSTVGSFRIGKVLHNLTLSHTNLVWKKNDDIGTSGSAVCVPVEEILSVHHIHSGMRAQGTSPVEGFTVCYVSHKKKQMLRQEFVQFLQHDGSQDDTRIWCERIQEAVNTVGQRPHKLLVLVNPVSGGKNGKKVYETVAAGVFKEAKIDTEVLVTERAHHSEDILESHDLTDIDGVVLVGGDGMYHEAVNGMQRRLMKEAGKNTNDVTASPQPLPVPLGLIPAGTGNGIAARCYGNCDPETAALAIVTGRTKLNSVITVHSQAELVGYSVLIVGYGFWADMIHSSDSRRHLGIFRYPVAMLEGTLVKSQRQMDLSIEYLPPLISESHDQENQPIMSEQDGKDQSTPVAHQPNKTEQINEELKTMKECQEDVGREPLKIIVTSSGDGGSEPMETVVTSSGDGGSEPLETVVTSSGDGGSEPMETVVTSSGDGGSEPMETVVTSYDAGSPDHKAEEKAEADLQINEEKRQVLQPAEVTENTEWKSCQGIYTGACVTIGSLKVASETAVPLEDCTRLLLNKPSGRIGSLMFFVKLMSQNHTAVIMTHCALTLTKRDTDKLSSHASSEEEISFSVRELKQCVQLLSGDYDPLCTYIDKERYRQAKQSCILRRRDKLEDSQVEHMLIKEYKVKLNNPSDPGSELSKKECMMSLDGEIFQLKQAEFHARLHPKLVALFASTTEDWCGENVK